MRSNSDESHTASPPNRGDPTETSPLLRSQENGDGFKLPQASTVAIPNTGITGPVYDVSTSVFHFHLNEQTS